MVMGMTPKPNSRTVLEALEEAGQDGMISREISQRFTHLAPQAALSETNLYLSRARAEGRALRGGKEATVSLNGRPSRCYRWYITPVGVEYLNPPPLPQINRLDEPPTSKRVLELLKEAGDEGMLGAVIARHFTIPNPHAPSQAKKMGVPSQNLQRRLAWTNQILDRFRLHGWVHRGPTEPTPYYHRVPVYRWFITPEGVAYLAAGMAAGLRAARRERAQRAVEQRTEKRKRQESMITQAYVNCDPRTIYKCEREKVIRELRGEGVTLDEIGQVFGLTRERIRQILKNYKTGVCKCPSCNPRWTAGEESW